jgi:hypothetical protein
VYGELPDGIDAMLFGVLEAEQLRGLVSVLKGLLKWAAQVLRDLSQPISPTAG